MRRRPFLRRPTEPFGLSLFRRTTHRRLTDVSRREQVARAEEVGIAAFGAYVPAMRLSRREIAAAHAWSSSSSPAEEPSERSVCGWDEDTITMAVEAARNALTGIDRAEIRTVTLATTTAPFVDRLNSGIIVGALGLDDSVCAQDVTGSLKAATSSLVSGVDTVVARGAHTLCVASEDLQSAAGTTEELTTGHAAAALVLGPGAGVARLLGSASVTVDLVDHYRASGSQFDYNWEPRWVRDQGYFELVPRVVADVLASTQTSAEEVTRFCLPCRLPGVTSGLARRIGLRADSVPRELDERCGECGSAHPLLLLVDALENAVPGDKLLLVGFGQGADVLLFEVTDTIREYRTRGGGVRRWLDLRLPCSYMRYLTLRGLLDIDHGLRAENEPNISLAAMFRHRQLLTGLVGGRCEMCGTHQIPRSRVCVNPSCGAVDQQTPHSFAESKGHVVSFSFDHLTHAVDPPACYGIVDFDEGGRLMMDFADVDSAQLAVGSPMRMVFRIKHRNARRNFRHYFWKAAPAPGEPT
jgi:hydroxymethylglutaryl-CoA synthase